jgi:hypothetical protein
MSTVREVHTGIRWVVADLNGGIERVHVNVHIASREISLLLECVNLRAVGRDNKRISSNDWFSSDPIRVKSTIPYLRVDVLDDPRQHWGGVGHKGVALEQHGGDLT